MGHLGPADDPEQAEDVSGYTYTHWDCHNCGLPHEAEGDAVGETFKCDGCGSLNRIGVVR